MTMTPARLQSEIQYQFKDSQLLTTALTHSSASYHDETSDNYERLEFLGDRVLGLVMAELLYRRFPEEREGDLAKRHAALVQGRTLAKVAERINLGEAMILSDSERQIGGAENEHILADGVESLIGAIYLDGGLAPCSTLIETLWDGLIDIMLKPPQDPKTELQEWAQGRGLPLPYYELIDQSGPDHAPVFKIRVTVKSHPSQEADGASRRQAEKRAAQILLDQLTGR